jgi:hypothetical protein
MLNIIIVSFLLTDKLGQMRFFISDYQTSYILKDATVNKTLKAVIAFILSYF